jgi:hypothetical protein
MAIRLGGSGLLYFTYVALVGTRDHTRVMHAAQLATSAGVLARSSVSAALALPMLARKYQLELAADPCATTSRRGRTLAGLLSQSAGFARYVSNLQRARSIKTAPQPVSSSGVPQHCTAEARACASPLARAGASNAASGIRIPLPRPRAQPCKVRTAVVARPAFPAYSHILRCRYSKDVRTLRTAPARCRTGS